MLLLQLDLWEGNRRMDISLFFQLGFAAPLKQLETTDGNQEPVLVENWFSIV